MCSGSWDAKRDMQIFNGIGYERSKLKEIIEPRLSGIQVLDRLTLHARHPLRTAWEVEVDSQATARAEKPR